MAKKVFIYSASVLFAKILVLSLIPVSVFAIFRWPLVQNAITHYFSNTFETHHIYDEADLLDDYHIQKFEKHLQLLNRESDIDIRIVFLNSLKHQSIDQAAIQKFDQLRVGSKTKDRRGLLLLYNLENNELRVEVGYGLEGYFSDAFVGYLTNIHAKDFMASGDVVLGFRLMIRMLHSRIREETLGQNFDPIVLELIEHKGNLSGGGGAATRVTNQFKPNLKEPVLLTVPERMNYIPQQTPQEAYLKWMEWLSGGIFDPRVDLFTAPSQDYLGRLPMTRAYLNYMLIREYGKKYKIAIKGNLALQYFTDSPLLTPHFYKKGERGWQVDIIAEVRNSQNRIGGVYVWDYRGRTDEYTKAFYDKFVNINGYVRIKDGDNRQLPIRGDMQPLRK